MDVKQVVGDSVHLGVTPNGKEIVMVRVDNASVRYIMFADGGVLPPQLKGGFSSIRMAKQATDSYVDLLKRKQIKADGTVIPDKK